MIAPVGALQHEVPTGARGDATLFDREGYGVGRQVLAPEMLRELRGPLIETLMTDGLVEPVEGEEDRFLWVGAEAKAEYSRHGGAIEAGIQELTRSGVGAEAIRVIWGRPAALWEGGARFIPMVPGTPTRVHRDGWHMQGVGAPEDHANMWIPLTQLGDGDGALAVAVGSHRIPDEAPDVPMRHPVHLDVVANTGNGPPAEVLAPLWHTTRFEVGDALLFRPDIVHATTANDGPHLRVAIVLLAQDARLPLPVSAGLSPDVTRPLSDVEWLTLALLTVQPTSPWLARCAFYSRGIIGRLWAEQPANLVESAFTTLEARELIEPHQPLDEETSSIHRYFHATPRGRLDACQWLTTRHRNGSRLLSLKLLFCDWLDLETTELLAR
jgi:hypothetical protein